MKGSRVKFNTGTNYIHISRWAHLAHFDTLFNTCRNMHEHMMNKTSDRNACGGVAYFAS